MVKTIKKPRKSVKHKVVRRKHTKQKSRKSTKRKSRKSTKRKTQKRNNLTIMKGGDLDLFERNMYYIDRQQYNFQVPYNKVEIETYFKKCTITPMFGILPWIICIVIIRISNNIYSVMSCKWNKTKYEYDIKGSIIMQKTTSESKHTYMFNNDIKTTLTLSLKKNKMRDKMREHHLIIKIREELNKVLESELTAKESRQYLGVSYLRIIKHIEPRFQDATVDEIKSGTIKFHLNEKDFILINTSATIPSNNSETLIQQFSKIQRFKTALNFRDYTWTYPYDAQVIEQEVTGKVIEDQHKGRYKNIKALISSLAGEGEKKFYHANKIDLQISQPITLNFIASQGPTKENMENFWDMIVHENVKVIVNLTGYVEKGKNKLGESVDVDKCARYLNYNSLGSDEEKRNYGQNQTYYISQDLNPV
jgi:hypothetical protein